MKRFLFVWWWKQAAEIYDYWHDGLKASILEIGKTWDVEISLGEVFPEEKNWECILVWGDINCPFLNKIQEYNGKKGIILTSDNDIWRTGANDNLKKLDTIFCESTPIYEDIRRMGFHAVKAFGTDTTFYEPKETEKIYEFFYPATFSPWKRQRDIAYLGKRLWCIGTVQPDGQEDLKACEDTEVNIAKGYFKAEYIRNIYQKSKKVIIPAVHGSERTVLEAMSCNIVPEIIHPDENKKAYSYIDEYLRSGLTNPRDFVVKNYNEKTYASKILKGLT